MEILAGGVRELRWVHPFPHRSVYAAAHAWAGEDVTLAHWCQCLHRRKFGQEQEFLAIARSISIYEARCCFLWFPHLPQPQGRSHALIRPDCKLPIWSVKYTREELSSVHGRDHAQNRLYLRARSQVLPRPHHDTSPRASAFLRGFLTHEPCRYNNKKHTSSSVEG